MKIETQYIFTEKEVKLIKECFDYVLHRKREHGKPRNISEQLVENLRNELNGKD